MDVRKVLAKIEKTEAAWNEALQRRTEDCFAKPRGDGEWTLGQACDHVTAVSMGFLDAAEALTRGEGEERRAGLMTTMMVGMGSLPPARFKVPPNLPPEFAKFAHPDPLTKAEALERFATVADRHKSLYEAVAAAPPRLRSKHPAAGWVNAAQWYKLSEMHMRHHLRQLRRIEKELDAG